MYPFKGLSPYWEEQGSIMSHIDGRFSSVDSGLNHHNLVQQGHNSYQAVIDNCCERIRYELDTIRNMSDMLNADYTSVVNERSQLENNHGKLDECCQKLRNDLETQKESLSRVEAFVVNVITPIIIQLSNAVQLPNLNQDAGACNLSTKNPLDEAPGQQRTTTKVKKTTAKRKSAPAKTPNAETTSSMSQPIPGRQPSMLEFVNAKLSPNS